MRGNKFTERERGGSRGRRGSKSSLIPWKMLLKDTSPTKCYNCLKVSDQICKNCSGLQIFHHPLTCFVMAPSQTISMPLEDTCQS